MGSPPSLVSLGTSPFLELGRSCRSPFHPNPTHLGEQSRWEVRDRGHGVARDCKGWLASAGGGEFWPMSQRLETSDLRDQRNWAGSLAETKSCPEFISTLHAPSKMNGWKLQFPFSTSGTHIPR